ncbi:DMT family transporter [Bowmanella pacifica]|uniref:Spermidine export protein MdtJ n=1 Tax=Bowmanella pacifica TaxID=502051 RepID=A0A917YXW3_9ALTE|nr:SMR family transporter [Bowmanella pacifica]GGO67325.1 QacE family quaternary ammonium compound efflux SMR transporter [Bowmanella pacifica]
MHWLFLILAVVGEVIGTIGMKLLVEANQHFYGMLLAAGMVGLAYLLLSQATSIIPVALANAFWEGLGMVLIALGSLYFLGEHISALQMGAIVLALAGIGVLHYGHHLSEQQA